MTALVVLPGLDGTATLHDAFAKSAQSGFESVAIIPYPADQALGYAEIEALVRPLLPVDEPFVLLGESFSGPIAISIAASPPPNLKGLVLSTTFAKSPLALPAFLAALTRIAPVRAVPPLLLSWSLLGRWSTSETMGSLRHALLSVSPDVLRHRAASALRADVTSRLGEVLVPVLVLRATEDRLLSRKCSDHMASAVTHGTVVDVVGPHLLLQTVPVDCARAISDFVARVT